MTTTKSTTTTTTSTTKNGDAPGDERERGELAAVRKLRRVRRERAERRGLLIVRVRARVLHAAHRAERAKQCVAQFNHVGPRKLVERAVVAVPARVAHADARLFSCGSR